MINDTELKLSIALTTYNHEAFIEKALDSILSQKVNCNYEIVIGEDLSTDNTKKIILLYANKYPHIIRLLERKSNLGYTKNFDDTLKQCKGEYIAIFDGDDIMLEGKLQKQVSFLDQHSEFVMVGHDVRSFENRTNKTISIVSPKKKKTYYTIEDLIQYGSFFGNCSKMFRREALPESGIDLKLNFIADWYVTLLIVKKGKIGYIYEILSEYRVHESSIMQNLKGKEDYDDKRMIIDKLNNIYNFEYTQLFKNQLAYAYLVYGIDELNKNQIESARIKFITSIKYKFNYTPSQFYYLILSYSPLFLRKILLKLKKPKQ